MKTTPLLTIFILALALPLTLGAARQAPVQRVLAEPSRTAPLAPLAWRSAGYPQKTVARLTLRELPIRRIQDVHNRNAQSASKPTQIGIARVIGSESVQTSLPALHWVQLKNGSAAARFEVRSPDALGLRLGLQLKALDPRVELRFAGSEDPDRVVAVVRAADAVRLSDARNIYWSPTTDGESQIVEVFAPAGVRVDRGAVRVVELSHLLASSTNDFQLIKSIGDSGSCNVDAVCRVGTLPQGYTKAKNAVARMVFVVSGGSYICTGTLLNDSDPGNQVPYFYSANHCISNATVANTLNTYWGYEATSCGSGTPAANTLLAGGASYLYSDPDTDALLLRLNNAPPAGATFAGWDATTLAPSSPLLAIHHPKGDLKKSSLGQHVSSDSDLITVGWTSGTTEGGSSGSGLFTLAGSDYFLRGGLYGGTASCANSGSLANTSNRDHYSRFDVVYPHISQYLATAPGNVAPVADFSVATSGLTATFTDLSADPDGSIASRSWSFGDGTGSSALNPVHTYATSGTYEVQLAVTDNLGADQNTSRIVSIGGPAATLRNGEPIISPPAFTNAERRYTMTVPPGATALTFTTTGGSGDVDLYVMYATQPTIPVHDCASELIGNEQTCSFAIPQAGTYHVLLSAYSAYSGVMLTGSYVEPMLPQHDFNGDRVSDILWRHGSSGANAIWNSASYAARRSITRVSDLGWQMVGVGDFDGDGRSDIFWRHDGNGRNTIWKSGNAATRQSTTGITNLNWKVVGIGDFNGDGRADAFWRNTLSGANVIWKSGSYSTRQATLSVANLAWQVVGIGDFDGDGQSDVLWRNNRTGANTIWRSGRADRVRSTTDVPNKYWQVAGVGDFDDDGKSDILWRNNSTGANTIWRGGLASSARSTGPVTNLAWKIVAVADYNGDRRSDILWRNTSTGANVVWRSGDKANQQAVTGVRNQAWTVVP